MSIGFLQPSQRKSACKMPTNLQATQCAPLWLSPCPLSPHSQLIEIFCPGHMDGSLLRHRNLEVRRIQNFRGVFVNALSKLETLLAASNPWGHFENLWPQKSSEHKDGPIQPHPWESSGKLGGLGEGQLMLRAWLRISPAHWPLTNQGALWALRTLGSHRLLQGHLHLQNGWRSGNWGDTSLNERTRGTLEVFKEIFSQWDAWSGRQGGRSKMGVVCTG